MYKNFFLTILFSILLLSNSSAHAALNFDKLFIMDNSNNNGNTSEVTGTFFPSSNDFHFVNDIVDATNPKWLTSNDWNFVKKFGLLDWTTLFDGLPGGGNSDGTTPPVTSPAPVNSLLFLSGGIPLFLSLIYRRKNSNIL